jgi:hypothetical protein
VTGQLWPELVGRLTGDVGDGFLAELAEAGAFAEAAPAASAPTGFRTQEVLRLAGPVEFLTSPQWTEPSSTVLCRQLLAALDDVPAR